MTPEEAISRLDTIITRLAHTDLRMDNAKIEAQAVLGEMIARGNIEKDRADECERQIDLFRERTEKTIEGNVAWVAWMKKEAASLLDLTDLIAYAATPSYRFMEHAIKVDMFLREVGVRKQRPEEKKA